MPPAALVSTTTRQPAAIAVRTPCTTVAGGCPSYRCVRPRNTSSRSPPATSERTVPAWPGTVDAAKPPRSGTGTSVTAAASTPATASAAGAQPDPRTTATSCPAWPVRSASLAALAAAASYGPGSDLDIRLAVGRRRPDPAHQAGHGDDGGDVGGRQQDVGGNRDVDRGQRGLQRVGETEQQSGCRRAQRGPAAEDHRGQGDVAKAGRHVLGEGAYRAEGQVGAADAGDQAAEYDVAVPGRPHADADGVGRGRVLADGPDAQPPSRAEQPDLHQDDHEVHDVEEDRRVEEDRPDDGDVAEAGDLHGVEREPRVQVRVRHEYPVVE